MVKTPYLGEGDLPKTKKKLAEAQRKVGPRPWHEFRQNGAHHLEREGGEKPPVKNLGTAEQMQKRKALGGLWERLILSKPYKIAKGTQTEKNRK